MVVMIDGDVFSVAATAAAKSAAGSWSPSNAASATFGKQMFKIVLRTFLTGTSVLTCPS